MPRSLVDRHLPLRGGNVRRQQKRSNWHQQSEYALSPFALRASNGIILRQSKQSVKAVVLRGGTGCRHRCRRSAAQSQTACVSDNRRAARIAAAAYLGVYSGAAHSVHLAINRLLAPAPGSKGELWFLVAHPARSVTMTISRHGRLVLRLPRNQSERRMRENHRRGLRSREGRAIACPVPGPRHGTGRTARFAVGIGNAVCRQAR